MKWKKRSLADVARFARSVPDRFRRRIEGPVAKRPAHVPDMSLAVPFGYPLGDVAIPDEPIAIVCHLFHDALAAEFRSLFDALPVAADLYLSTDTPAKRDTIVDAFAGWARGTVTVAVASNRGRDIGPKLVTFRDVYPRYPLVLFLHGKRSLKSPIGDAWRRTLTETLIGSPDVVRSVLDLFARHPRLGIVLPQHFEPIRRHLYWDSNFRVARGLAQRMGFAIDRRMVLDLPSGSMFWARPAALRPLLDLKLGYDDFPPEQGQTRGTVQHAVERLFLFVCEAAGFDWVKIAAPACYPTTTDIERVTSRGELDRLVRDRRFSLLAGAERSDAAP